MSFVRKGAYEIQKIKASETLQKENFKYQNLTMSGGTKPDQEEGVKFVPGCGDENNLTVSFKIKDPINLTTVDDFYTLNWKNVEFMQNNFVACFTVFWFALILDINHCFKKLLILRINKKADNSGINLDKGQIASLIQWMEKFTSEIKETNRADLIPLLSNISSVAESEATNEGYWHPSVTTLINENLRIRAFKNGMHEIILNPLLPVNYTNLDDGLYFMRLNCPVKPESCQQNLKWIGK